MLTKKMVMKKGRIPAVSSLAALHETRARKVIVGGELVFASTQLGLEPRGFVAQRPRETVGGILGLFKKSTTKVNVFVHPDLLSLHKTRFGLVIDGYLSWGLRQSGSTVVFGGIESDSESFTVYFLVFDGGRLVDFFDRTLPGLQTPRFAAAAQSIVSDVRGKYTTARIVQSAPLSDWGLSEIEHIGEKALRLVAYRPLSAATSSRTDYLLAGGIALSGLLVYSAAIAIGWTRFSDAQERYESAAANPAIKQQGGIDNNYINVMTQRRLYMEAPRRQEMLAHTAIKIVRGLVEVPGVQIIEMRLPAPSLNPHTQVGIGPGPADQQSSKLLPDDRAPDTLIRISVPRAPGSALEQGKEVLELIKDATGMSVRLAHQGWQDGPNGRRIYTVEGFIHG